MSICEIFTVIADSAFWHYIVRPTVNQGEVCVCTCLLQVTALRINLSTPEQRHSPSLLLDNP
jgi:hypothetical protein